jgi:hypothetical protein
MSVVYTKEMLVSLVRQVIKEADLCHSADDGTFTDCDSGAVYSLSHKAAAANNIYKEFVGRGKVTKNRKLNTPFGMNTSDTKQCGRQTIQGDPKKKDRRCHDYPKGKYNEDSQLVPNDDDSDSERKDKLYPGYGQLRQLANGIYEDDNTGQAFIPIDVLQAVLARLVSKSAEDTELMEDAKKEMEYCQRKYGLTTKQQAFKAILDSINAIKRAESGDLYKPEKE